MNEQRSRTRGTRRLPVDPLYFSAVPVDPERMAQTRELDVSELRAEEPTAEPPREDGLPQGARHARDSPGQFREQDAASSFFTGSTQERAERERAARDAGRPEAATGQDPSDERLLVQQLRYDTLQAAEAYRKSLKESKFLAPGFSPEEGEKDVSKLQRAHTQMMVQACMRPLKHGLKFRTLVQSAGMFATLHLLSPEFREEVGKHFEPLKAHLNERIEQRLRGERGRADRLTEEFEEREGRPATQEERDGFLAGRWRDRVLKSEHAARGHRDEFSPYTAALTELGLTEQAAHLMRESADPRQAAAVMENFEAVRERLRDQMKDDGLEPTEVAAQFNVLLGQRMDAEPELRLMFEGMSHGGLQKGPERVVQFGDHPPRKQWAGDFVNNVGEPLPEGETPRLRMPMNARAHQEQITEVMQRDLDHSLAGRDGEAYSQTVAGYVLGFAARQQQVDTRDLPPAMARGIDQSSWMLASMNYDGLSGEEQQHAYSQGFARAMSATGKQHPEVGKALESYFGKDWRSTLEEASKNPFEVMSKYAAEHQSRGFTASRSGAAKESFDWGYERFATAQESDAAETDFEPEYT